MKAKIEEEFCKKQRLSSSYSLRAFAKFLGIQPATLSAVLKGKRSLPLATAEEIALKLKLSPLERSKFLESIHYRKKSKGNVLKSEERVVRILNDEMHFKIISEWEHYAVLSLMDTKGFKPRIDWIAKRLGITILRSKTAWNHLLEAGLIIGAKDGTFSKTDKNIGTTEDITSAALKKSHLETLTMAAEKLEQLAVNDRDYSSTTIAVNLKKLREAKEMIRLFRKQMSELLEDQDSSEVFELAVQFFQLTENKQEK